MENLVFYRKYRPEAWEEVIGQEHIVSVLSQSIKNRSFSHAYLFTGSRGAHERTTLKVHSSRTEAYAADPMLSMASSRAYDSDSPSP